MSVSPRIIRLVRFESHCTAPAEVYLLSHLLSNSDMLTVSSGVPKIDTGLVDDQTSDLQQTKEA